MKKALLPLLFFITASLTAYEPHGSRVASANCSICACTPCCCRPKPSCEPRCCDPCCVPESAPCIDCECYSPAFYDLSCDWGLSLNIEFLYWYARESNLAYALKVNQQPKAPGSSETYFGASEYEYLDTKWDPGFRVGIGCNSSCDGWDSALTWTWIKNSRSSTTSVPEFSSDLPNEIDKIVLINPWINQSFHENAIALFNKVSASWSLTFNQIDWSVGRKYYNSRCFTLRPYMALRGAWWKTRFGTTSTRSFPGDVTAAVDDDFTNRVWGVGIVGGLEPTWYLCSNFALFGNLDGALLWGEFEIRKSESILDETIDYRNKSKGDFYQMSPMIDAAIGLRWEETWCCNRIRTALDLGWEHHVIFDQNHRMKTYDHSLQETTVSTFRTFDEVTGNLGMGGFVLSFRMDF